MFCVIQGMQDEAFKYVLLDNVHKDPVQTVHKFMSTTQTILVDGESTGTKQVRYTQQSAQPEQLGGLDTTCGGQWCGNPSCRYQNGKCYESPLWKENALKEARKHDLKEKRERAYEEAKYNACI